MKNKPVKVEWSDFKPSQENMEKLLEDLRGVFQDLKWGQSYLIGDYLFEREADYGGEGQGEDYWVVVKVSKGEDVSYWKFDGWYASYDGGYLENVWKVEPREKLVTVYE